MPGRPSFNSSSRRSNYFFGTGSVLGAEHLANFFVVLSRHEVVAAAGAGHLMNLPLASRQGSDFALAADAERARTSAAAVAVAVKNLVMACFPGCGS